MYSPVILILSNLFSSDMIVIAFVALLLFGGEKLPEIARGLGKGIRDFKDASEGVKREINNQINSFEEKREEKKMDELIMINQGSQNQLSNENYPTVENTIPVNDSFSSGSSPEADKPHQTGDAAPETEKHITGNSAGTENNE